MESILLTGGSGFFGSIFKQKLLAMNYCFVNIDLENDDYIHENLVSIKGDIRDRNLLTKIFSEYKFKYIVHCAAILAHATNDKKFLWSSNVDGTRNIAEFAKKFKIPKVIFISSNCLWGENFGRPIQETDTPNPVEIYGKSKLAGEKILLEYTNDFQVIIFRVPTIMDSGRLGLLAILFEFINDGRKVWVVDGGKNRYQFIYAGDLVDAILKAFTYDSSAIFNLGSDNVKTFKEVYEFVIAKAGTKAKIATLNKRLVVFLLRLAHFLKISPLGTYHYKMISEDFEFDTSKAKNLLNWQPTLTNEEMLYQAYQYYHDNAATIKQRKNVSAHKQAAKMGVLKILKWL